MSSHKVLGIIGGGQLGSMLCQAAKKIGIKTVIYCDDIKQWCHRNRQHKKCPVFIQYNDKQPVKVEGEGIMFSLYEELDQCDNGYETRYNYEVHGIAPPDIDLVDGLSSLGGRL